jgi:hypothetical protein
MATSVLDSSALQFTSNGIAITAAIAATLNTLTFSSDAGNLFLNGLQNPTTNSGAATKSYVDNANTWKLPATVATTSNIDIATALVAGQSIDGVVLVTGDRVLLKDQTTASENGIYLAVASGAGIRSSDMAAGSAAAGIAVYITEGTVGDDSIYTCTTDAGSDVTGTDAIVFGGLSTDAIIAGDGLTNTDDTFSVNVDALTIELSGGNLQIVDAGVENVKLVNSDVTVTAGDGLQNGGAVALGAAVTVDVDATVIRTTGAQSIAGVKTFTDEISATAGLVAPAGQQLASGQLSLIHDTTNGIVTNAVGNLVCDNTSVTGKIIQRLGTDTVATGFEVQNNSGAPVFSTDALGAVFILESVNVGSLTLSGSSVTGLTTPSIGADATNKTYVDNLVANGISWKEPAVAASTANVAIATELTNADVIDGVTLATDDRVLLKNQTTTSENGIYIVAASGAASRSDDLATGFSAAGASIFVTNGTVGEDVGYTCSTNAPNDVVGTDDLTFTAFASGIVTGGDGLTKTGNVLSVNVDGATLEISGDNLRILDSGVTNTKLVNSSVTVTAGDGLSDGGAVALGAAVTVNVDATVVRTTAAQTIAGVKSFTSNIDAQAGISILDGQLLSIGTGDDFTISHDGTNTTQTSTTGDLITVNSNVTASNIERLGTTTSATSFVVQNSASAALFTVDGAGGVLAGGAITGGSISDGTATLSGGSLTSAVNVTGSGTITGGTITDGALSITGGNITGAVTVTASGTITGGTLTDGTLASTSGTVTGAVGITASGTVTGGTFTDGVASLNAGVLTGIVTPSADSDAANKAYVDTVANGLSWKGSAIAASTTNVALATDVDDGSILDGVTILTGERILLKNQTTETENGIWVVAASGAPSRPLDFDTGDSAAGSAAFVIAGTTNADRGYLCTTDSPSVIDTNDLHFTPFSGVSETLAGDGLTKTDNTISANTTVVRTSGAQSIADTKTFSDDMVISSSTEATTTTVAAVVVYGGIGVAKDARIGGDHYALTYNTTSDRNLKTNIVQLSNTLDTINQIESYEYDWKGRDGPRQLGVMAQQLEEIGLEHMVATDSRGVKSVNYNHLLPLCIGAIRELSSELEALKMKFV